MHNHIGGTCLASLQCVFSYVSSSCLVGKMRIHTGCISLAFVQNEFLNVFSKRRYKRMHSHICGICSPFLLCVLCVLKLLDWMVAKSH